MTRKTKIILLGILGVVASASACCCCVNWFEDPQNPEGGQGRPGHVRHRSRGWFPIFFGSGGSHRPAGPSHSGGSSGTSRGGFGATGSHGGGVGA